MEPLLVDTTENPEMFFDLLPPDWREGIEPSWLEYRQSAHILALLAGEEVLGGGIVFATVSPDALSYRELAQSWFDRGFLYIGFLYFSEKHRGRGLGSRWITLLRQAFPGRKFWLTIDDRNLAPFYERNGFDLVRQIDGPYGDEWLLAG